MNNYIFTLKQNNADQLLYEINFTHSSVIGLSVSNNIIVHSNVALNQTEIDSIQSIINSHTPSLIPTYKKVIRNAIEFGNDLLEEFAAENILSGITQAGKTKDVADYLVDATRYLQTGSLYEVMNECDRLIAAGIPVGLSPFVTETKLNNFKTKIIGYLS